MINYTSAIQQHREAFRKHKSDTVIDLDKYTGRQHPFYIARLQDFAANLNGKFPLRRQSHHYFELIRTGSGYKTIGCCHFEVSSNMLITVPARMIHSGFYERGKIDGYVLGFDLDFFLTKAFPRYLVENKSVLNYAAVPYAQLTDGQVDHLATILECLLAEADGKVTHVANDEIIAVKILEFLIFGDRYCSNPNHKPDDANHHKLVYDFNKLIDKHFVNERSVIFYASLLNMHPNSLNAVVKFHSGLSAKNIINQRISDEAKYLLANTILSIKELACRLGFDDPNYFSYFFKRETGFSPVEFKQSLSLKTA